MSEAFVVRYRTTAEAADENQRLVEAVYAELAQRRPEGVQYATFRLADGVSFVHTNNGLERGGSSGTQGEAGSGSSS